MIIVINIFFGEREQRIAERFNQNIFYNYGRRTK